MRGITKKILLSGLLIFLIFLMIGLGCKKQTTTEPEPTTGTGETETAEKQKDLSSVDPQDYSIKLENNFNQAVERSKSWQKNAQFVFLRIQIPADLNPKRVVETYVFTSTYSPTMYWTIGFSLDGSYIRALIPKSDYLQNESPKTISTKYWQTDWITAFQKADQAGGKEFREKNESNLDITASLTYVQPKGYLYWVFQYKNLESEDKSIIRVDANTGELEKENSQSETESNSSETD